MKKVNRLITGVLAVAMLMSYPAAQVFAQEDGSDESAAPAVSSEHAGRKGPRGMHKDRKAFRKEHRQGHHKMRQEKRHGEGKEGSGSDRKAMREKRKEFRQKRQEMRKEHREKRQQHMKERRAHRQHRGDKPEAVAHTDVE